MDFLNEIKTENCKTIYCSFVKVFVYRSDIGGDSGRLSPES